QFIVVPADQLGSVWYLPGSAATASSNITVQVYDSSGAGNSANITVGRSDFGQRPDAKSSIVTLAPGTSAPVTRFFAASDPEGNPLTYTFSTFINGSPVFTLNGQAQTGPSFTVAANQLDQVRVQGNTLGFIADTFIVQVSDGGPNPATTFPTLYTNDSVAVVSGTDVTLALGQVVPLSSLF